MSASSDWGIPRHSQASVEIYSLHLVLGLPHGLLPDGCALRISLGMWGGGLLTRCPNHLNWLLSMQRSSGSIPSPSQMAKLIPVDYIIRTTSSGHQDYIICKKQWCNPQPTKLQPLSSTTAPWNPVHEYHKQDRWQGAALMEANPHWEVRITAEKPDTALALGVKRLDGPE